MATASFASFAAAPPAPPTYHWPLHPAALDPSYCRDRQYSCDTAPPFSPYGPGPMPRQEPASGAMRTSVKSIVRFEHFVDSSDSGELLDETTRDILQCANMLLSPGDLCFLWLCYLYFVEFRSLPAGLFCIERGSVGRLCSTDSFEIPWDREEGLTQSPDTLLCAFHEAVDELGGPDKCVALFASHLNLLLSQSMGSSAVQLCSVAVGDNPGWSDGWLQLVELYVKAGDMEKATNVRNIHLDDPDGAGSVTCRQHIVFQMRSSALTGMCTAVPPYIVFARCQVGAK
ncbi:hypothetical protein HPB51_001697 [Rhipicephalus microplus]|uniref:Uncharacterized protein n=1 Tax=Rhipicephalus microplus TaxID=6941 RepID=A0A9J6E4U5_RHIMP|nr:hypothetical protein HPB51_001697 [Rhipicephalus microplus]